MVSLINQNKMTWQLYLYLFIFALREGVKTKNTHQIFMVMARRGEGQPHVCWKLFLPKNYNKKDLISPNSHKDMCVRVLVKTSKKKHVLLISVFVNRPEEGWRSVILCLISLRSNYIYVYVFHYQFFICHYSLFN